MKISSLNNSRLFIFFALIVFSACTKMNDDEFEKRVRQVIIKIEKEENKMANNTTTDVVTSENKNFLSKIMKSNNDPTAVSAKIAPIPRPKKELPQMPQKLNIQKSKK